MEKKFTGLVIGVQSNAKVETIISLLTVEEGLVNLAVQNPKDNITFKSAKELFTFAFFTVKQIGDFFYDLRKCEVIETFDNIKTNGTKLQEGLNMLLATKEIVQYQSSEEHLLHELLTALKTLNYENTAPNLVLTKLLIHICDRLASISTTQNICLCGENLSSVSWFDITQNRFVCSHCKNKTSVKFEKQTLKTYETIKNTAYSDLKNIQQLQIGALLQNLQEIYKLKVGERIKFYRG